MARIRSFEPIGDRNAEVLILGSMPGTRSLAAGQYYAHPHNVFWRILSELLHFDAASSYEARVRALKSARIALWDVLHSCVRAGSLDAMIENGTQTANDFRRFFGSHGKISRVYFNGATAETCYRRHVLRGIGPGTPGTPATIGYLRLPSTSPANASMPYAQKLRAWRAILGPPVQRPAQPRRPTLG